MCVWVGNSHKTARNFSHGMRCIVDRRQELTWEVLADWEEE